MRTAFAIALLALSCAGLAAAACSAGELGALKQLYLATGGANWNLKNGWAADQNCCAWSGIQCNAAGSVTALDLTSNNLSGNLPPVFDQLPNLASLRLISNPQLTGTLPVLAARASAALTNVNVAATGLSGAIPANAFGAAKNIVLDISNTAISNIDNLAGASVSFLGASKMSVLFASGNAIGAIAKITALTSVTLNNNAINNWPFAFKALPQLATLSLSGCGISAMPAQAIIYPPALKHLIIASNAIQVLPAQLFQLTQLQTLDVSYNKLSGSLPVSTAPGVPSLANLVNLRSLVLGGNAFSGVIPAALTKLTQLTTFDLSYNQLTGSAINGTLPWYCTIPSQCGCSLNNNPFKCPLFAWMSQVCQATCAL